MAFKRTLGEGKGLEIYGRDLQQITQGIEIYGTLLFQVVTAEV